MASQEDRLKAAGLSDDKIDEFRVAFRMFDADGSGVITAENLGMLLNGSFGECGRAHAARGLVP